MAGTYVEGRSEVLSGVYTLIQAIETQVIGVETGIVAYPFTADWGPVNTLVPESRQGNFAEDFNAENSPLTAKLIHDLAFAGNPFRVLSYRMATDAAKVGSATLAEGWTLETKYPSNRSFTLVVRAGVAAGTTAVQLLENGVKLFEVEDATVEGLTMKLNASGYVTVKTAGSALPALTAGVNMTGGDNGSAVTNTQYAAFLDEVEGDGTARAFSLDGVTEESTLATVVAWVKRVRSEGLYITMYRGGPAGWDYDLAAANVVSKAANNRSIINIGDGADGYTPAQMAIFQAAYEAGRGLNTSVTDQPIPFTRLNNKKALTRRARIAAKEAGTLLYVQQGEEIVVDEGINTLTNPGENESVYFGKSRVSRTIDYIASSLEVFGEAYKRRLSNTPEARATYASTVEDQFFAELARMNVIEPGYSYIPDPDYHGPNPTHTPKIDEAFFVSASRPVDSMEKIYQKLAFQF